MTSFLRLIVSTSKVELKYKSTNLFSWTFSYSMAFSISFTSLLLVELQVIISLELSYINLVNSFKTLFSLSSILSEL